MERYGLAVLQVVFRAIEVFIDVEFLVIEEDILPLLSMKDMVQNRVDSYV